jgi:LL-H family phage holin
MSNEMIITLVTLALGFIVSVVKVIWPLCAAKITASQMANIQLIAKIAILAAEQIFKEIGQGQDKKEFVKAYLKKKFPKLTDAEIDLLIEGIGKNLGIFK